MPSRFIEKLRLWLRFSPGCLGILYSLVQDSGAEGGTILQMMKA